MTLLNHQSSLPFEYQGYTSASFRTGATRSFYLESYDKTRIAVDLTLPEKENGEIPASIPTIIQITRWNRRNPQDQELQVGYQFVPYGYAYLIVELRGCGVSYGIADSFCDEKHCRDLIAAIDWVKEQSWSSGKIGVYGGSNRSFIQLCAAAYNPKNLSVVTPVVAVSDFYYQNYPNGVSACPNIHIPKPEQPLTREEFLRGVVPVDEDPDGIMAYEAYTQFQYDYNLNFFETLPLPNMNRDTPNPIYDGELTNLTIPPYGKIEEFFRREDVKQHQFIGELESGTLGQLAHYMEFGGSAFLGPWTHEGAILGTSQFFNGSYSVTEANLRWFDHSLKGIENGWDQAPEIAYYVFGAEEGQEWRFSESWPPENEIRTKLFLSSMKSASSRSVNDGSLVQNPEPTLSSTEYNVRTDLVVFPDAENHSAYNRSQLFWDGDMEPSVDQKGLTFTSAPLFPFYNNEFAGCISVNLWISCNKPDVDLVVYAEEVFPDQTSHYIKDGVMRASHRTLAQDPSWEKMGAFRHSSMTEDVNRCLQEGLDKPTLVQFAIDPITYHFAPGSRIRLTITCANPAAFQHPMYDETPATLTVYTGGEYASYISIPFLEAKYQCFSGMAEFNGTVAPAALYTFDKNSYLYTQGMWHKFPTEIRNSIDGSRVLFENGSLKFQQTGKPLAMPLMNMPMPVAEEHPFPRYQKIPVSREPVTTRDYTLFVPGEKTLYLEIFKKQDLPNTPCILYVHGYGAPPTYLPSQLKELYENGYAIACVDVRNYPPNLFPDYIHDAKGAIRLLRAKAEEFGLDPERFGIYGFSLGGNTSLMLSLSGDHPELEGTVGGNLEYSSRLQACAAGFAWFDLLNMGKDISEETSHNPALQQRCVALTEGEFSPSSEVIGFAGEGLGLKVLREYLENGCTPRNEYYDQKLQEAFQSSPLSYVNPSVPPIALFGGYGEPGVNIAFKQSLRTFNALNEVDATTFLYGNTNGKYGEMPETISSLNTFFDQNLKADRVSHRISFVLDSELLVVDYVSRRISSAPVLKDGVPVVQAEAVSNYLEQIPHCTYEEKDGMIDLTTIQGDGVSVKYYEKHRTLMLRY